MAKTKKLVSKKNDAVLAAFRREISLGTKQVAPKKGRGAYKRQNYKKF